MRRRAPVTRRLPVLALALGLALAGCAREAPPASPMATTPDTFTLTRGYGPLQVTPRLRLATGNFWPEETDAGVREPSAALFIYDLRAGTPSQQHVRVHAGQVVEAAGEVLEVIEVVDRGADEQWLHVRLRPRKP